MRGEATKCRIGSNVISAVSLSSTSVSCAIMGKEPPGSVEIAVADNGVDFVAAGTFFILPEATTVSLNPVSGPLSGGIPVEIRGTGFSAVDTPSCLIGGSVVNAEVLSTTVARCVTPTIKLPASSALSIPPPRYIQYSNNRVDFDHNRMGDDAFGGLLFTYYRDPVITSMRPSGGTLSKMASVVLNGHHLVIKNMNTSGVNGLLCRLGEDGLVGRGLVSSPTQAVCDVACGNFSGSASVGLSLNGGYHWTFSETAFPCDPLPTVTSVFPPLGPTTGGTVLTIKGTGFVSRPSLSCLVGHDAVATPAVWISSVTVVCSTPAVSGEGVSSSSISVSNNNFHFSSPVSTVTFNYVPPSLALQSQPTFASVRGTHAPLTVTGTNFINVSTSSCHFIPSRSASNDDHEIPTITTSATFLTAEKLTCPVPGGLRLGTTTLAVSANGVDFGESTANIEIETVPMVSQVVPARGMAGAMVTPIEVRGYCVMFEPALK